ncbi:MAG: hypothetical protein K1X89_21800, partial [Myxococcaceae bacterium]|nr:hypothetical protein [Myxococcaceae bacterium]
QGGGAGGSAGGAPGGAGGGATSVPGWSQHVHGFTGQSVFTGCALEVDALRGNKVVSTIRSALDSSDRATANQSDAGALPKTGNGHLRGRFQLPSTLKLSANSTWLVLQAAGTTQLSLAFNSSGQLVCRTEAGMVGPTPITQTVTWPGGFLPNQDYLVDFTWKQGQFRRLTINGGNLTESLIGMDAGPGPKLDQLRLGIYRYDGTSDAGWTLTLSDWQLADDPNANLTD